MGLVFPAYQHVAQAALYECRRRAARAGIKHRYMRIELADIVLRGVPGATGLAFRRDPRREIGPARAAGCLGIGDDNRYPWLDQVRPVVNVLRIALPDEEYDR